MIVTKENMTQFSYRLAVHILFLVHHFKFKTQVVDRNLVASGKILHST